MWGGATKGSLRQVAEGDTQKKDTQGAAGGCPSPFLGGRRGGEW